MTHDYSHCTFDELREIREAINLELTKRKNQLREERFNAMMKAIREFKEICPYAKVCDYEESISITEIADRNMWEFGE
jgi:hypothetical protein